MGGNASPFLSAAVLVLVEEHDSICGGGRGCTPFRVQAWYTLFASFNTYEHTADVSKRQDITFILPFAVLF